MREDRFLIITGLSGSGKTVFSHFLEDLGFYCVDNLPSKLIPIFVQLWERREVELDRVALVVDMREAGFLTEFPKVWEKIRKRIAAKLIFLEASDDALIKRFSESRRPHPLSRKKSVIEAVRLERERLKDIKKMADEVIDTTEITINHLKTLLRRSFSKRKSQKMQISVVSFGYKYGIPMDSDLVFDTRFLPNPFYIDEMRDKTGRNQKVKEYVLKAPETKKFLGELYRFIDFMVPNFLEEDKSYLTIACGCTGGKHRSVIIAEGLKEYLRKKKYDIRIYHRDIYK
ncbi:MAG: RNase adapter RapZ [Candidatus Aminicenantes bacterium]|nr:RNase adapter RapZ [Candidatus Aminicenantes bacterium]